jgi:acyl-CoA thioesterase FadM
MGRLRELALVGLRAPMLASLSTGRAGMVTESAWVKLDAEASALDRIEAHAWVEELGVSSCILRFSFDRLGEAGSRARVGEAAQRFGWVDVLGHGLVRAAAFPPFLREFLAGLHHAGAAPAPGPLLLPNRPAVASASFPTTLVEGNVVGNLYYGHYFRWTQRVIDLFLFRNAPEVMRARGALGELLLSSMRIEFMREAMPFDTVDVTLHPADSPDPTASAFDVVFARREPDGGTSRLAMGHVTARWSLPERPAADLPEWLRAAAA